MTLPSSFPISASQINVELGRASNAAFDIQGAAERELAQVSAGAISFSDFLNKSILTVTAHTNNAGGASPFTFSALNAGVAFSDRWLIAAIALRKGGTGALNISSVTIGGVTASGTDSGSFGGSGPSMGAGLFYANVPAGSTADVVVTFTGGPATSAAIILMNTPRLTFFNNSSPAPPAGWSSITSSINLPSNGVHIAVSSHTTGTPAWTGVTSQITETMTGGTLAVAYDVHTSSQTGQSVKVDWGSSGQGGFELASFSQS